MNDSLDLTSLRARKARLWKQQSRGLYQAYTALIALGLVLLVASIALNQRFTGVGLIGVGLALIGQMGTLYFKWELSVLKPHGTGATNQTSREALALLSPNKPLTPRQIYDDLGKHWQAYFLANHLMVPYDVISVNLSTNEDPGLVTLASQLADGDDIQPGHFIAAAMLLSPELIAVMQAFKLTPDDIKDTVRWLDRNRRPITRPFFGGIGRDWANGFTNWLNRFGQNISLQIESQGISFGALTEATGVQAMRTAFSQGAHAVALVGDDGVGKTSHVQALAQILLEEKHDRNLEHRQIISLKPTELLAASHQPGALEELVMLLLNEAAHAGHIILLFDDAAAFFENGVGAVDISQVLSPVIQSGSVQMIFTFTPQQFQHVKTNHGSFANLLSPIIVQEPAADELRRVVEDAAIGIEHRHKTVVAYEAISEAIRLSGRYDQDRAYPGKALSLLERASRSGQGSIVSASSVQQAIEETYGVKVGTAGAVEADQLINLEAAIGQRMIGQKKAVSVVASALRRARAGVANPRRPVGSFLFLGPTGVGKTELAKAIATTYYGSEQNIIRLDMSEYQQPTDVQRLLDNGGTTKSLILAVREQPFSVVLLDELEKAHPNVLNLLLQMLDEGHLTDGGGRSVSFKDCVIICTSNAGAQAIRENAANLTAGFETELTDQLISSGQFKPELLNRFDEIVLFAPLKKEELLQVLRLMLDEINRTLNTQNIKVELTLGAAQAIVEAGYDARLGARPLRRVLQRAVEDYVANKILRGEAQPGQTLTLNEQQINL